MKLYQAYAEWLALRDQLVEAPTPETSGLAAPFFSVPDPTPSNPTSRPIMFIGKATNRNWFIDSYEDSRSLKIAKRIEERRSVTKTFLTDPQYRQHRISRFWRMWKKLREMTEAPVIWSNAAKIGAGTGNPGCETVERQAELAISTLRAEVNEYKPRMLIFVTGYFARYEIVAPFLGLPLDQEKDSRGTFYTRRRSGDEPAVLWTGHPGWPGAPIGHWVEEAVELLNVG